MRTKDPDEKMAALRGQHWSTDDARRVLAACDESRLTQAAFCRQHGLQPKRLSWWRKRLREWDASASPAGGVRFVPAVVPPGKAMQVKIRLPGEVAIEIAGAEASFVASLMRELRERAS